MPILPKHKLNEEKELVLSGTIKKTHYATHVYLGSELRETSKCSGLKPYAILFFIVTKHSLFSSLLQTENNP